MNSERVTLADVAEQAGVSKSTASAALNGTGRVDDQTRETVRVVARHLGYRPHTQARSLANNSKFATVAAAVFGMPGASGPRTPKLYWAHAIYAGIQELARHDIATIVMPDLRAETIKNLHINALIIANVDPNVHPPLHDVPFALPIIATNADTIGPEVAATVSADQNAIMATAMDHLTAAGAKNPAFLMPPKPMTPAQPLIDAYTQWCQRNHRPVLISQDDAIGAATNDLLARGADAFLVHGDDNLNDVEQLSDTIRSAGLAIPADILVISMSEGQRDAALDPGITTLSLMGTEHGILVAQTVINGLNTGTYKSAIAPFELQIRASTLRND